MEVIGLPQQYPPAVGPLCSITPGMYTPVAPAVDLVAPSYALGIWAAQTIFILLPYVLLTRLVVVPALHPPQASGLSCTMLGVAAATALGAVGETHTPLLGAQVAGLGPTADAHAGQGCVKAPGFYINQHVLFSPDRARKARTAHLSPLRGPRTTTIIQA